MGQAIEIAIDLGDTTGVVCLVHWWALVEQQIS
jgi:hypothetical protein